MTIEALFYLKSPITCKYEKQKKVFYEISGSPAPLKLSCVTVVCKSVSNNRIIRSNEMYSIMIYCVVLFCNALYSVLFIADLQCSAVQRVGPSHSRP